MKQTWRILLLALLALGATTALWADEVTGKVVVEVTDESGAAVEGAIVKIVGPQLPLGRAAASDENGVATFPLVPPGTYTVTVQMPGFAGYTANNVTVQLGRTMPIKAGLKAGGETVVEVTGDKNLVDFAQSSVGETISYDFMDNLPNARSFQEVMNLLPGVLSGNNPSINGSSQYDNMYLVDGTDTTDPRTQTWGSAINFDIIDQWELQTAGFKAEYGRATGGIVNLITKSGTNEFHGGVRVVGVDVDWNEDSTKPVSVQSTEYRASVWMSGPIVKDKLYYLWSWERRDRDQDFTREPFGVSLPDTSNYHGYYLSAKLTWDVNEKNRLNLYYQRDPIDITNAFGRFYYPYVDPSAEQIQSQGGNFWNIRWSSIWKNNLFFEFFYSDYNGIINFYPQVESNNWTGIDLASPLTYYGNNYNQYYSNRDRQDWRASLSYIQDTSIGTHNWKFGVEVTTLDNRVLNDYYTTFGGDEGNLVLSFGDLWVFEDPTVNPNGGYAAPAAPGYYGFFVRYQYLDLPGVQETQNDLLALYIQDDWEVNDRLTFNLGLRADSVSLNNNIGDEVLDFGLGEELQPRLGFTWDVTGEGRHKLSGGIARYYDVVTDYVTSALNVNPPTTINTYYYYYPIWGSTWAGPYYPTSSGDSNYIYGDLDPTYEDEIRLGYDWQLRNGHVLRFNLVHSIGKDAIEDVNLGLGLGPTDFVYDSPWFLVDPTYSNGMITGWVEGADTNPDPLRITPWNLSSYYYGYGDGDTEIAQVPGTYKKTTSFQVSYWKPRKDTAWDLFANYTWTRSRGLGDNSLFDAFADNPAQLYNRQGRLATDRPVHLKVAGNYWLPWAGLKVSGRFEWVSGAPWTPFFRDILGDGMPGSGTQYVESRGSRRTPSIYTLDLQISKEWKMENFTVELYADILNVTDVQRGVALNGQINTIVRVAGVRYNVYNPAFYDALVMAGADPFTQYSPPRQYRLGVSVKW